jgi:hypothetical protein
MTITVLCKTAWTDRQAERYDPIPRAIPLTRQDKTEAFSFVSSLLFRSSRHYYFVAHLITVIIILQIKDYESFISCMHPMSPRLDILITDKGCKGITFLSETDSEIKDGIQK